MDGLEHGGGAAVGVGRAVDPGVAMVAGDDPVSGSDRCRDLPMTSQMVRRRVSCSRRMWTVTVPGAAEVIGEGEPSLPVVRRLLDRRARAGWVRRRRRRAGLTGMLGRSYCSLSLRDALGVGQVGRGGDAGRGGIAGIDGQELHGAALHGGVGAVGALGIHVALEVAVVGGVGVDEDALGSVLLGDVDLDAAIVAAVADEDDLVLDADAEGGELLEVGEAAVVGVDDARGDVGGGDGAVEGGQDAGIVLEGSRRRTWLGSTCSGEGPDMSLLPSASKASMWILMGLFRSTL